MSEADAAKLMEDGEKRLTKFAPFTSTEEKHEKAREKFLQAATQYKACNNWTGAGMAFKRAADMSTKLKSEVDLADDLLNSGQAFRKGGDPRAEEMLNTVVDLYDKNGKFSQAAKVCTQIADLGGPTAEQWYSRAVRYMRNEGSKISSHDIVMKMAMKMIEAGRFEAARVEFEKMAREYCDEHLTRSAAKKHFFNALCCTVAQWTSDNLVESVALLQGRFQEYTDLDPMFNDSTLEYRLMLGIIEAGELGLDGGYDKFGDAVAEYEEITPLDTFRQRMLLRGKMALRPPKSGGGGGGAAAPNGGGGEDDTN